ncbi:MAG: DUF1080 domain-containing protein [Verrucomicrobiota bacterium]
MRLLTGVLIFVATPLAVFGGEWVSLFDGKSTVGWTPRAEVVRFEAVDGVLELESEKNVWVLSDLKRGDFVFEGEVKIPADAAETGFNSGLAFRCVGDEGKPKGYQLEIDGPHPGETGGVYAIGMGGWIYPTKETKDEYLERIGKALKKGEWNRYRVECEGPRIRTYVNDVLIADVEDDRSLEGSFGIQHHGKGGVVRFRNLRVKELSGDDG